MQQRALHLREFDDTHQNRNPLGRSVDKNTAEPVAQHCSINGSVASELEVIGIWITFQVTNMRMPLNSVFKIYDQGSNPVVFLQGRCLYREHVVGDTRVNLLHTWVLSAGFELGR